MDDTKDDIPMEGTGCYKNNPQNIYLVQLPYRLTAGKDVYGCGFSHNIITRLSGYPSGTDLIASNPVTNMHEAEKQLLKAIRAKFPLRVYRGSQYFEGTLPDIMKEFSTISTQFDLH